MTPKAGCTGELVLPNLSVRDCAAAVGMNVLVGALLNLLKSLHAARWWLCIRDVLHLLPAQAYI